MKKKQGRKAIDMTGARIGKVVVIAKSGRTGCGRFMWRCRCDCGTVVTTDGCTLRRAQRGLHRTWQCEGCRRDESSLTGRRKQAASSSLSKAAPVPGNRSSSGFGFGGDAEIERRRILECARVVTDWHVAGCPRPAPAGVVSGMAR